MGYLDYSDFTNLPAAYYQKYIVHVMNKTNFREVIGFIFQYGD